ncbi:MAG: glycosyltransferase family 61 protein [Fischerella sp.]|nr:glycosyltransferase family 61 protein [Fischerella sp.]
MCSSLLQFPKTFIAIVPKGKVWVDFYTSAIITSDGLLVEDVSTGNAALIALSNQLPAAKKIDGTVACLAIRYSHNYFHWMFDLLPRIEFLCSSGININNIECFIVNSFHHTFQIETLSLLGIDQKKFLEVNGSYYIANNLIATSSPFNKGKIPPQSCNFLRRAFLSKKVIESEKTAERIYISRQTASYRRVINESEVTDFLKKYGFETIQLESMSVTEQIKQMAAVKVVIAPHGAGLTNIVFCNPGTKIIEIFSPDEVIPYYWIISNHIGLEYYYLIGNKVEDTNSLCKTGQNISIITDQGNIFVALNVLFKVMKLAGVV